MLDRFARARVFIIDDAPLNVALLRTMLTRAGMRDVFTETDSRRVRSRLSEVRPDLIVLDLHMPHLDGFAVLEQIRRFSLSDYLPVLMLTADTSSAATERALAAGAQDFITKPFNTSEVLLRVRNLLETRFLYTALRSSIDLGSDAGEVLQLIASRALELSSAGCALIALPPDPDPDTTRADVTALRVVVCIGAGAQEISGSKIPIAGSTAGAVFTDGVPRNVTELAHDIAGASAVEFGPALLLPLGTGQSTTGVLVTARTRGSVVFDDQDLKLVSTFAEQAGSTLQRNENQRAQHELAMLADRDRIAQELHGRVIRRLFAVSLAMQSTHHRTKRPDLALRIAEHIDQVDEVIQDIAAAVFDLQDEPGKAASVRSTLQDTITELTADAPLRTSVRMSGPLEATPPDLARHSRAVVREAVGNAVRHAHAHELMIAISAGRDLVIDVTDDGVGIDDDVARRGMGTLRDRATQVGGTCMISRTDDGGTHLVWTAPLP